MLSDVGSKMWIISHLRELMFMNPKFESRLKRECETFISTKWRSMNILSFYIFIMKINFLKYFSIPNFET